MKEKYRVFKYLFLLILFLIIISCAKQEPEPIVARAEKTAIPLSEFRDRYEFTPHVLMTKDTNRNKRQLLTSLLGEKILAEEAYHRNLNRHEKFLTYSEQMEKEAIVEALFEQEVASKIQISNEEIRKAFLLSQSELDVQVVSFDHIEQAWEAKKQLDAGKSFHQMKREFQTDSFISADSVLTFTMKWGEAHPKIEEAAFKLKSNEVSDPLEADGIIFIIKLIQKRTNVILTESDYVKEVPSIRKKIKQRKQAQLLIDFMHSLMAEKKVKVSHEIFDFVSSELEKFYPINDSSLAAEKMKSAIEFKLDSLQNKNLADRLNDTFARFNDGSIWTVADFIKKLSVGPYRLSYTSQESFRNSLSRAIKTMIEFESLAKKGKDAGLQNTYYVRYQKKMWDDAYLAQEMRLNIIDTVTVSDKEVRNYYDQHKSKYLGPEMVNLHEILVDDEALAQQLYQRIKAGEEINKLARVYNKREISQKSDGIMGYFSISALGRIGEVARNLNIGEIAGPIRTEQNQFSVFKVLDKKMVDPLPLEDVYANVKRDALNDKRNQLIDQFLTRLTDKYEIKINHPVLDTLTTVDVNMFVLKQHFPNRMIAPLVAPLNNMDQWQNFISSNWEY